MLMPKRTKYRKSHRGKNRGIALRGSKLSFGEYGIQALENCELSSRQIESARKAITRHVAKGGKLWIRVFPDHVKTARPQDTRMGKGKGAPSHWVCKVKTGKVLFEVTGITEELAKEAMVSAGHKLPCMSRFIKVDHFLK